MFHAREDWRPAAPVAAALALQPAFGRKAEPFSLAVDLGEELFSRRWWRGAATLGLLCTTAALLLPPVQPLRAAPPEPASDAELVQAEAIAIAPLSAGSRTGLQMAATDAVEPLVFAPDRATIELALRLGAGDTISRMLTRAGATQADAAQADAMIRSAASSIAPGTSLAVTLGRKTAGGARPVERIALRAGMAFNLTLSRTNGGLTLASQTIAVDTTPLRVTGRVGDGLYWSLRAAGASPQTAAEYLQALAKEIDVGGDVGSDDRFDLVIANRRAATGESRPGPLLYAGIDRVAARDIQLVKWPVGGRPIWVEASSVGREQESAAMAWPVAGRITSTFGYRIHPILRFARFHGGVDFGARWGSPIVAAADGRIVGAGWSGGYGRQVQIAHGGGTVTTYSHMSRIVAEPGGFVRRGDLIGYVGSSGLSTGPHLHYEVIQNGRRVNPLGVRFASRPLLEGPQREAFKARLKQLLSVGVKKG